MFFPYRDDNPRVLVPYVTYGLLAANILVFLYQFTLPGLLAEHAFTLRYGLIPAYFWGGDSASVLAYNQDLMRQYYPAIPWNELASVQFLPGAVTLFTSAFVHGGWLHIISNMLFLMVFADNVEGALGHGRFILFYLLATLAAGMLHLFIQPDSMQPVVGASGAISGVLGGYLVRYPRARIHVLVFIFIFFTTIRLPALVVLGWWFLLQAINGVVSLKMQAQGGIAWFEHIGGFMAGFSYMAILTMRRKFSSRYGH